MKKNIRTEFKPDSVDLVNFILKYFRLFTITGFAAALIAAAITLLIKPLFESSVILYPSSNIAETRSMLGIISSEATLFGDDDGTERLLQILNSEQVREYLKTKYNLPAHYKVKPDHKYPNTLVAQKMRKYIHSSKTSYGSVAISVRDQDKELACNMANDIAARADTIFNNLQRGAAQGMLSEINKSYEQQLSLIRLYEDTLKTISGLSGNRNSEGSAAFLEAYFGAMITGGLNTRIDSKNQISTGKGDMVKYFRLLTTLESETDYLSLIRGQYIEAQALSQQTLPYTLVVDKATVAEKKVYPKRSLMVIVSTASVLLLLALLLFVAEGVKVHRTDDQH